LQTLDPENGRVSPLLSSTCAYTLGIDINRSTGALILPDDDSASRIV
jgi:hypothetical protein